jgi:PncC family amidohydrolase
MNNANELINRLVERGLTIGAVESFTGGLFAKALTDVSGSSRTFRGAIVPYATDLKTSLLGIPAEYIEENGVVSYEVAQQMAIKGQRVLGVDVCVSFTGNAGPAVCEEGTNVGELYMAVAYKGQVWPIPLHLDLSRDKLRQLAVDTMIDALLGIIL